MRIVSAGEVLDFFAGDIRVARYNFRDPFKPCFHPLCTPSGLVVSAAGPHDHKHQKGLMYALRTEDINFWEEVVTLPGEVVGHQRHEAFVSLCDSGEQVGFTQSLVWEAADGTLPTFTERRTIALSQRGGAIAVAWSNHLTALRDMTLVMSQWSRANPAGQRVNYHGLALRMVRDFANAGGTTLLVDGRPASFADAMGRVPREVTFNGTLDPVYPAWPPPKVSMTFAQSQPNAMFFRESPWAFLSLGPSNLAPRTLRRGEEIREAYTVTVADVP